MNKKIKFQLSKFIACMMVAAAGFGVPSITFADPMMMNPANPDQSKPTVSPSEAPTTETKNAPEAKDNTANFLAGSALGFVSADDAASKLNVESEASDEEGGGNVIAFAGDSRRGNRSTPQTGPKAPVVKPPVVTTKEPILDPNPKNPNTTVIPPGTVIDYEKYKEIMERERQQLIEEAELEKLKQRERDLEMARIMEEVNEKMKELVQIKQKNQNIGQGDYQKIMEALAKKVAEEEAKRKADEEKKMKAAQERMQREMQRAATK